MLSEVLKSCRWRTLSPNIYKITIISLVASEVSKTTVNSPGSAAGVL